jgi:hypothetical protein
VIAIALHDRDAARADEVRARLEPWLDRAIEIVTATTRNQAVARAQAPVVHFACADALVEGSFLALASRLLDRRPELDFVTGWSDAPASEPTAPRACTTAMLLGRPLEAEAPALFRRQAARFDEQLAVAQDVDLCMRLDGWVIDVPPGCGLAWGGASGAASALYQKHRALLQRDAEEILVIKERWLRGLAKRADARAPRSRK